MRRQNVDNAPHFGGSLPFMPTSFNAERPRFVNVKQFSVRLPVMPWPRILLACINNVVYACWPQYDAVAYIRQMSVVMVILT